MTRRSFVQKSLASATGLAVLGLPAAATARDESGGFRSAELVALEAAATAFMAKHDVPGLSVAIATRERLVYTQGFGLADKRTGEAVTPLHRFRIASVSKPFTSAAIFRLIETGKLKLSDRVFGPNAVLGLDYGQPPASGHIGDITIEHLLTHTAGGWTNDGEDPMFDLPELSQKQLITWTIAHRSLDHPPGTHFAYSNFGFCILGRVIEKVTGKPYSDAMAELIFKPCGITGMKLAGNTLAERAENEVVYYDQSGESPYVWNVRRMDSHGGWLATPADLVRFLVRVDNFPVKPDILKSETIRTMTTASAVNANYAKGWYVNSYPNWWHGGSLPGTTTIMVRTSGRFCWAALTNTRKRDSSLDLELDQLMWHMVDKITAWPAHDLFT